MSKRFIVLFFAVFIPIIGCVEKQETRPDPTQITDKLPVQFKDSVLAKINLRPDALKTIGTWKGYEVLDQGLNNLDNVSIGDIKSKIDEWVVASEELQRKKPDSLKSKAIETRLTVLNTKTHTLKQEINKREIDTAGVNKEATELYNAFQDLKLQVNMRFQSSIDDLLNEFDTKNKEMRKTLKIDSVQ